MKRLAFVLLLAAAPAAAQDAEPDDRPITGGIEQMLRDLFSEVEPHLRELRDAIGDLNNYQAPEVLPNGDIIIRRKTPLNTEPDAGPGAEEEGPVEI